MPAFPFCAALLAIGAILTSPIDTLRIQAQTGSYIGLDPSELPGALINEAYSTFILNSLWWDGALACGLRVFPLLMITTLLTPYVRRLLPYTTAQEDYAAYTMSHSIAHAIITGIILVVIQPLDTCRTRMVVHPSKYGDLSECISSAVQREGAMALWRGYGMGVLCSLFLAVNTVVIHDILAVAISPSPEAPAASTKTSTGSQKEKSGAPAAAVPKRGLTYIPLWISLIAFVSAGVLTTPFVLIRERLMLGDFSNVETLHSVSKANPFTGADGLVLAKLLFQGAGHWVAGLELLFSGFWLHIICTTVQALLFLAAKGSAGWAASGAGMTVGCICLAVTFAVPFAHGAGLVAAATLARRAQAAARRQA